MFTKGTEWVRADFHLHTKADKEFIYMGEEDRFISDYVEKLREENIGIGVITNHNKFDLGEYKAIKKKAKKHNILVFPGVELSVKEGANGIHCLLVFKDSDWISGSTETINNFLDEVFKGIENREHENTRCNYDLPHVINCLNTYKKDYFIIMAHVEQKSGFFKECDGGLITSLSKKIEFKERILGFQKGRSRDGMTQIENWMGYEIPYVEGSDCKSIEEIGKGKHSFIKIGENSFESLLFAFKDFKNRISLDPVITTHGYIKSIEFLGGKLDGEKIYLSPELNSLIGIRGSGKSSIIEAIRYALDMSPSKSDSQYKKEVVENLLVSGGKIVLELQDNFGKNYKIKRIFGENLHILDESNQEVGAKISSVLNAPLYFGQKDLSNMDNGFELNLLNKLVGKNTKYYKKNLKQIENRLSEEVKEFIRLEDKINNISELKKNLQDTRHKIKIFEEKGLSDKLSKQVNFNKDKLLIESVFDFTKKYEENLKQVLNSDVFDNLKKLENTNSEEVPDLFKVLSKEINQILESKKRLNTIVDEVSNSADEITKLSMEMKEIISSLEEEFAEIKREIDIPNLNPEDFSKLKLSEVKTIGEIEEITLEKEKKIMLKIL